MKSKFILFLLGIIIISACEKDDFCTQNPVTPKLILRFYDANSILDTKTVERFSAVANSKTDSLYRTVTTDSIVIPLNPTTNQTIFTLKRNMVSGNMADNEIATLTINYNLEEDFVSRSCGFRIEYTDLILSVDNSWISSITPQTLENINSQSEAHVQVFH